MLLRCALSTCGASSAPSLQNGAPCPQPPKSCLSPHSAAQQVSGIIFGCNKAKMKILVQYCVPRILPSAFLSSFSQWTADLMQAKTPTSPFHYY